MFTEDPVATISISSPAAAPLAKISIPPAVALMLTASAPVPAEDKRRLASFAPVTPMLKSSPSLFEARVMLLASTASIDTAAPASIVTPPAVALISTAEELVPCVLVITIVSLEPIFAVSDIAEAASSFETRAT